MRRLLVATLALALAQGCRTTEPIGRQIDDTVITSKLNAKLAADPDVNLRDVSVQTDEGVVTLTGRVGSSQARSEADRLARETDGVSKVRNDLAVGSIRGSTAGD